MYKHADIYVPYLLERVDLLQTAGDVVLQDFCKRQDKEKRSEGTLKCKTAAKVETDESDCLIPPPPMSCKSFVLCEDVDSSSDGPFIL